MLAILAVGAIVVADGSGGSGPSVQASHSLMNTTTLAPVTTTSLLASATTTTVPPSPPITIARSTLPAVLPAGTAPQIAATCSAVAESPVVEEGDSETISVSSNKPDTAVHVQVDNGGGFDGWSQYDGTTDSGGDAQVSFTAIEATSFFGPEQDINVWVETDSPGECSTSIYVQSS